jgi:putative transposase
MPPEFRTNHRQPPRLVDYDYSSGGAYFVTICTARRASFFGSVLDGQMDLSPAGQLVDAVWQSLPRRFPGVFTDAFIVMPNHVHGIVILDPPDDASSRPSLAWVIRTFKTESTHEVRKVLLSFGWQSNYYEHVVRNEHALQAIREYIENNPAKWEIDEYNPVPLQASRGAQ